MHCHDCRNVASQLASIVSSVLYRHLVQDPHLHSIEASAMFSSSSSDWSHARVVEPRRTEGPPRMTEEPPQKARKAQQKRSQVAANLDAVLGIKGGSMSNLLNVVNALAD